MPPSGSARTSSSRSRDVPILGWSRSPARAFRSTKRARLPEVLQLAYGYITRRERTIAEVRARLQRADVPPEDIEEAIHELVSLGCLDDRRYARVFTEDKRALEGWGNDRIENALRQRGIDRDLIELALAGEPAEEQERAVALLARRLPGPADDLRERERALGILLRKGYERELAYEAVRRWAARSTG